MSDSPDNPRAPSLQELKVQAACKTFGEIMQEIHGGPIAYVIIVANGAGSNVLSNAVQRGADTLLQIGLSRLHFDGHRIVTAGEASAAPDTKVH